MATKGIAQPSDKTFILIAGAGHGSWCWKKVKPLLEDKGYKVLTPDLPSTGSDTSALSKITFNDDIQAIINTANTVKGKVILLGHSSGGVLISQAAELLGIDKVDKLIYLDAFLPQNGESVFTLADKLIEYNKNVTASQSDTSHTERFIFSDNKKVFKWNPEVVQEIFFHDCSKEDIAFAKAHLRWESVSTLATPVHLTDSVYGKIKKYYILCTNARDLNKSSLTSYVNCVKKYELPSSHSPYFSMPEKLVAIMEGLY